MLVDRIVYDNWLRGEFGSPDVPQAQQLRPGPAAGADVTKPEVAEGRDTAELAGQKKAAFVALADRMGDRYTYFQGKSGSRIGVGVLAVIQAACIAMFQLLSKVLVLTALLLLRLMVMTPGDRRGRHPQARDPPGAAARGRGGDRQHDRRRRAGRSARAAGRHDVQAGSGIDLWLAMLVTGGGDGGAVGRRRGRSGGCVSMVSLTNEQFGGIVPGVGSGPMSRVWQRIRGASDDDRQSRWWEERRSATEGFSGYSAARPEAEPVVAQAWPAGAGPRTARRHTELEPVGSTSIPAARRQALPAGPGRDREDHAPSPR